MTGRPVFSELEEYLIGHFPPSDLRTARPIIGEIHLRYELGDPYERAIRTLTYEEIDSGRESHEEEHPVFRQICLSCPFESSSYQEVLSGIANYEQGREPAIGQQVVFLSMERDLIFQMYDDRGCLVYSDSPDKIRYLYEDFNEWLVEGWRERFDAMFSR